MRAFLIVVTALFALSACDREGPAEKAGEKIDKAVENAKDAVKGDK